MNFTDLMQKIGRGEKLDAGELAKLRDETRSMGEAAEVVKTWGGSSPTFSNARFETRPIFRKTPSDTILFARTTDTSIVNNTATYVAFEATTGKSDTFKLDPADATIIRAKWAGDVVRISGYDEWASNATGYRAAQLEIFTAAGASIATQNLHVTAPVNGDITGTSWSMVIDKDQFPSFEYFKVIVRQTSGAGLDLRVLFIQPQLI